MHKLQLTSPAVVLTAVLALPGLTLAQSEGPAARYSAVAVDMLSPSPGAGTTPLNIVINRWATEAERDQVMTLLMEQGPDALLSAMQKWEAIGSVAATGGVGFDIRYATQSKAADGTEHVFMLTDRPMSFFERRDAGRSTDYPFTLIQLEVQPSGEGQGQIAVAARLRVDKRNQTLVIDNFSDQPVTLRGLKKEQ